MNYRESPADIDFAALTQAYIAAARLPAPARARLWYLRRLVFPAGRFLYCYGYRSAAVTFCRRAALMVR
jgi:hypothetical protein